MIIKKLFNLLILTVLITSSASAGKLEQLIAENAKVTNFKFLSSLKNFKASGTIDQMGMVLKVDVISSADGKFRVVQDVAGQKIILVSDSKTAWVSQNGQVQEMPIKAAANQMRQFEFFKSPLMVEGKDNKKFKLLGREKIDGKDAYKIEIKQDSITGYAYMGKDDFLVFKQIAHVPANGQTMELKVNLSNFQKINNATIPLKMELVLPSMTITFVYTKIEFNVKTDDSMFKEPETSGIPLRQ